MNRHTRTRISGSIGAAAAALLVLGACGLGDPGDEVDQDAIEDAEIEGQITFQTMQLSPTFDDLINGYIEDFEDEYPEVTVEWVDVPSEGTAQKLNADAASDNLPDVLDLDIAHMVPLAREGRLLDIASVVPEAQEDYLASAWETFDIGGEGIAALPWYLNTPVLVVNEQITGEAGIDEHPQTWEDLLDVSAQIGASTDQAGFQLNSTTFEDILLATGTPIVNEDGTEAVLNTAEAEDAVERLHGLYQDGGIPADSITAQDRSEIEAFQEGELAYLPAGPNRLSIIEENAPDLVDDLTVTTPVTNAEGEAWIVSHGLAVPTTSENPATAVEFARFVSNPENQLALSGESVVFPSTPEALEDPFFTESDGGLEDEGRVIAAQNLIDENVEPESEVLDQEIDEELWSQMQLALMGDEDIATALERAEEELNTILQGRTG